VIGGAVYPGTTPTSNWAWVLLAVWFFGLPLVMLCAAAYVKLSGKELRGQSQPEHEAEN
jgi:hypothetical protein